MAQQMPPEKPKPQPLEDTPKTSADSATPKPDSKPIITDYASL